MVRPSTTGALLVAVLLASAATVSAQTPRGGALLVELHGVSTGEPGTIPVIKSSGTTKATCFRVDGKNPATGKKIADVRYCVSDAKFSGAGATAVITIFYRFPGQGILVTRHTTTIQPILAEGQKFDFSYTSAAKDGVDSVLSGSGRFAGYRATAREVGASLGNFAVSSTGTFYQVQLLFQIPPAATTK